MRRTGLILCSVGMVFSLLAVPSFAVGAVAFFLLAYYGTLNGLSQELCLLLGFLFVVFGLLSIASMVLGASGRTKTLNDPTKKRGFIPLLVGGILGVNLPYVLAAILLKNAPELTE